MIFEVQTQVRLPNDAGEGGHHPRRTDNALLYPPGSIVHGERINPAVLDRLIEKGTLAETTESAAARKKEEDAALLKAAAEAERAKAEAAKAAQKGGKK